MSGHNNVLRRMQVLILAGLLAVATALGYRWFVAKRSPTFSVSAIEGIQTQVLADAHLRLKVKNPGLSAIRIVGSQGNGCGPGGCVFGIEPDSFDLAPGETREVFVLYKAPPITGPFEKEFIIYSATNTLNEHKLKITGIAVAPKKKDSENQKAADTKEKPEEQPDVSDRDS